MGLRTEFSSSVPNVIGGTSSNAALGVVGATIGGGGEALQPNRVNDDFGTVGGGKNNTAGDIAGTTSDQNYATVAGGFGNSASGRSSTVSGGGDNIASGIGSTAGGGEGNRPSGEYSTVGGGFENFAQGSSSTVPGGSNNTAQGNYSLAAGRHARAVHHGSFVWSDSTHGLFDFFSSTADNQFLINATGGVGIGTTNPSARLHVAGVSSAVDAPIAIVQSSGSQVPLSFKSGATEVARIRSDSNGNLVFATLNGTGKNIHFRAGDDAGTDMFIQSSSGNIGIGNTAPATRLDVSGSISLDVPGGTGVALCRDGSRQIVDCTASSVRYKQNILGLRSGLDVVRRLRPVSFTWKKDGQRDIGLVAEEVNRVEPLLATRNDKGDVEGVRYDRLGVVLLNAVKEQQTQIRRSSNSFRRRTHESTTSKRGSPATTRGLRRWTSVSAVAGQPIKPGAATGDPRL